MYTIQVQFDYGIATIDNKSIVLVQNHQVK